MSTLDAATTSKSAPFVCEGCGRREMAPEREPWPVCCKYPMALVNGNPGGRLYRDPAPGFVEAMTMEEWATWMQARMEEAVETYRRRRAWEADCAARSP